VSRFVCILKPTPSTDIVNQNGFVTRMTAHYVLQELREAVPVLENYATLCAIRIRLDNRKTARFCIVLNCQSLVVERILLMFGGHANILSSGNEGVGGQCGSLFKSGRTDGTGPRPSQPE
jgi:hypothetical protein